MWKFVTKVPTGTLQIFSAFFAMRFQRQWSQENSVRRRGGREVFSVNGDQKITLILRKIRLK